MGLYNIAGHEINTDLWPKDERTFIAALDLARRTCVNAKETPEIWQAEEYEDAIDWVIDIIESTMLGAETGRTNFGEYVDKTMVAGISRVLADYAMEPLTIQAEHIYNYVKGS